MKLCNAYMLFSKTIVHCLTITDMQEETAAHCLHEAREVAIVHALHSSKCENFARNGFLANSQKNMEKIEWEWYSTFLLGTRRMGMTYSSE